MIEGFYFGRFQPPSLHHGELVRTIKQNHPDVDLTVGVADSDQTGRTSNNFLEGIEVANLFKKMLYDLGLPEVGVLRVPINTEVGLVEAISQFLDRARKTDDEALIFSGSPSTIAACRELISVSKLKIVELPDDDQTGPRGRLVRQGLLEGSDEWRKLVAPSVMDFLAQPSISERIKNLPSGEKRPWTKGLTSA